MNLSNLQTTATRFIGRSSLLLKKHSPEILLGAGLIGGVVAAIMAAKATLKLESVLNDHKDSMDLITLIAGHEPENFSKEELDRAKALVYVQTGLEFTKLYGPSFGLGVLSIASILGAHGIMSRRQVSLIAAYNLVNEGFQSYRKRVVAELGEETDRNFHLGLHEEIITENGVSETGEKVKVKKKRVTRDVNTHSIYAKFFDETSREWSSVPETNLYRIQACQNYANDLLKKDGHVFLNQVYDMLGIPRTQAGQVVGWVLLSDAEMERRGFDPYIDFDIWNPENEPKRDFINGYNPSILLDFNVHGVVWDILERV